MLPSSREPSTVALEGKVDEFGPVRVSGTVTPLDPRQNTDLHVVFENVEMPKFSAYSIPLAGREIASGRLDLDLGYKLATRSSPRRSRCWRTRSVRKAATSGTSTSSPAAPT